MNGIKTKHTLPLLLLFIFLSLLIPLSCSKASNPTISPTSTGNFLTYIGDGFSIPYPSTWEAVPPTQEPKPEVGPPQLTILFQDKQQGTILGYLYISKEYLQQDTSMDAYFNFKTTQDLPYVWQDNNYTPLSTENLTINGQEAKKVTYEITNKSSIGLSIKETHTAVYFMSTKLAYTLEASSMFWDDYKDTFNKMILGFTYN